MEIYEITGSAALGTEAEIRERKWWMLFWNPEFKKYPWFTEGVTWTRGYL